MNFQLLSLLWLVSLLVLLLSVGYSFEHRIFKFCGKINHGPNTVVICLLSLLPAGGAPEDGNFEFCG